MKNSLRVIAALVVALLATVSAQSPEPKPAFVGQTDAPKPAKPSAPFTTQMIATGLTGAWAIAFLPDGNILVTQNSGTMRIVRPEGVVSAPLEWFPRLRQATSAQRSKWRLIGGGIGIHWEDVDEDISVESLLALS